MIWIQANSLSLILRVTKIILEKDVLPITHPDYPLEVSLTKYQWANLEEFIVLKMAPDIILGNICFWDSANREYLDVSYDPIKKILTLEGDKQYFVYESDSLRPLSIVNI
jgi:hypothetical protein